MVHIHDGATLARALHGAVGPHVRDLLAIRRSQLGDSWPDAAAFHVAEAGDTVADVEAAVGFPLTIDGEPCWEWAARHEGVTELCFVLSDDGPAQVVLVPDRDDIDAELLGFVQVVADPVSATGEPT